MTLWCWPLRPVPAFARPHSFARHPSEVRDAVVARYPIQTDNAAARCKGRTVASPTVCAAHEDWTALEARLHCPLTKPSRHVSKEREGELPGCDATRSRILHFAHRPRQAERRGGFAPTGRTPSLGEESSCLRRRPPRREKKHRGGGATEERARPTCRGSGPESLRQDPPTSSPQEPLSSVFASGALCPARPDDNAIFQQGAGDKIPLPLFHLHLQARWRNTLLARNPINLHAYRGRCADSKLQEFKPVRPFDFRSSGKAMRRSKERPIPNASPEPEAPGSRSHGGRVIR